MILDRISFTVAGDPVPWARAGGNGKFRFTPKKQRDYGATIRQYAQDAMGDRRPMEGPIRVKVVATYLWPKSLSPKKRLAPGAGYKISRPDADNLFKLIADKLNTVVWRDDSQVCSLHVLKVYGDHPSVSVTVEPLA